MIRIVPPRDWVVPYVVGFGLMAVIFVVGGALEWSNGAIGTACLGAMVIGLLIRFRMHDYEAELERDRRGPSRR